MEQERNVEIIQGNIEFILGKCVSRYQISDSLVYLTLIGNCYLQRTKIENDCPETTMTAYTEIVHHLEQLDLASIKPEVPIASGIIDLSGSEDPFANLLSDDSKQILMYHMFSSDEITGQMRTMVDDFVSTYIDLRPDFDLAFMRPIAFPQGEMPVESRRTLMMVFDLLEGLYVINMNLYGWDTLCDIYSCLHY